MDKGVGIFTRAILNDGTRIERNYVPEYLSVITNFNADILSSEPVIISNPEIEEILQEIDTGPWILSDKSVDIFEPFSVTELQNSNEYLSTELGLTVVKKFVSANRGNIHMKNIDGSSACFTVSLPLDLSKGI